MHTHYVAMFMFFSQLLLTLFESDLNLGEIMSQGWLCFIVFIVYQLLTKDFVVQAKDKYFSHWMK